MLVKMYTVGNAQVVILWKPETGTERIVSVTGETVPGFPVKLFLQALFKLLFKRS